VVNALLKRLGELSYSVYLIHFAVVGWHTTLLAPRLEGFPPALQLFISIVVVLAASTGLAMLTWRWIEQPGIAVGSTIVGHLRVRAAERVAP
jgi:peptidoglycan/LPS O-acetylase OafA/YrhL